MPVGRLRGRGLAVGTMLACRRGTRGDGRISAAGGHCASVRQGTAPLVSMATRWDSSETRFRRLWVLRIGSRELVSEIDTRYAFRAGHSARPAVESSSHCHRIAAPRRLRRLHQRLSLLDRGRRHPSANTPSVHSRGRVAGARPEASARGWALAREGPAGLQVGAQRRGAGTSCRGSEPAQRQRPRRRAPNRQSTSAEPAVGDMSLHASSTQPPLAMREQAGERRGSAATGRRSIPPGTVPTAGGPQNSAIAEHLDYGRRYATRTGQVQRSFEDASLTRRVLRRPG